MRTGFVVIMCMCLTCLAFGTSEVKHAQHLPTIDVKAFTELRMGYAKLPNFSPTWESEVEREEVINTYESGDNEKFLFVSDKWLSKCPVDATVHRLRAHTCASKNDLGGYFSHMHFYYGLLASIAESGDGRTSGTAMKVISVAEEYYVLRHLGAKLIGQSLVDGGFDMMECEIDGEKITLFFDVSIPLNAIGKELGEQEDEESDRVSEQTQLDDADMIFDTDSETLDICEAVFRYQFEHNVSAIQKNAKGYFLFIFKKDPSKEFLARFKGETPTVMKGSEFSIGKGLLFSIQSVRRKDEKTVEVRAKYYESGKSFSINRYILVQQDGSWVVQKDKMEVIG